MRQQKVFFTADLHFGHENAIRFDNRPFASVEEMDKELVARWNAKVAPGDLVYVLGDFIWKSYAEPAERLIKGLHGQIILIKGNHDRFIKSPIARDALAAVKDYADISVTLEDGTPRRCILSHYFIPMYNGHRHNAIHLHGHSHNTEEAVIEFDIARNLNDLGIQNKIYNVGCMYWNYEPVTLDEILRQGDQSMNPAKRLVKKISYKKLWKILIDKELNKKDFAALAGISSYAVTKMGRGDDVTLEVLDKICCTFNCSLSDIREEEWVEENE